MAGVEVLCKQYIVVSHVICTPTTGTLWCITGTSRSSSSTASTTTMRSTSNVAGCAAATNGIRNMTKPWNTTTVGTGGVGL